MPASREPLPAASAKIAELLELSASGALVERARWEALASSEGPEVYAEALRRLTRLDLPVEEARETLHGVLEHQTTLSTRLGRPVGIIAACADYVFLVRPLLREPMLIERRALQQKEECAYRDELTGLFNRRSFNQELPREIERFRRFGHPFSLLMLDLDHFKDFNDRYGHSAGDLALCDCARIMRSEARLYDRVVRYGGEEFAVILPQTSSQEAVLMAERIREAMDAHRVRYAGEEFDAPTISIGVATFPQDALSMDDLVDSADRALYHAKQGRNQVCRYQDSKRSHPRYALSAPLPFRLVTGKNGGLDADALDLSLGGLSCRTSRPLPAATTLHLVLSDPERLIHLALVAEVRRVAHTADDRYQLGLSFRLEGADDQMKLMALLEGRMVAPPKSEATAQYPEV